MPRNHKVNNKLEKVNAIFKNRNQGVCHVPSAVSHSDNNFIQNRLGTVEFKFRKTLHINQDEEFECIRKYIRQLGDNEEQLDTNQNNNSSAHLKEVVLEVEDSFDKHH